MLRTVKYFIGFAEFQGASKFGDLKYVWMGSVSSPQHEYQK